MTRAAVVAPLLIALALAGCGESGDDEPLTVPDRLTTVVPRLLDPDERLAPNLLYEANNPLMRRGLEDGAAIAARWRAVAEHARGLFVLRDSLWAEQDHPTRTSPNHLMLPPSWVLIAAAGSDIEPVQSFAVEDSDAWANASDLFGGYPMSATLYGLASADPKGGADAMRRRIVNARESIRQLSRLTHQLHDAAPQGWRAVVTRGAELIAAGDRAYFGARTRRRRIIPIFVENPNAHEILEGKGWVVPGFEADPELQKFLVAEICRVRLRDGDIALERYDLSDERSVERALGILTRIIPAAQPGETQVWLWVNGHLRRAATLQGDSALAYAQRFWRRASDLPIDLNRLKLLSKPPENVGPGFQRLHDAYRDASLYMSLAVGAQALLSATRGDGDG